MSIEFEAWPKIPRFNREIIVTEKIDGTNAAVVVHDLVSDFYGYGDGEIVGPGIVVNRAPEGETYDPVLVYAQSRKRIIDPEADNAGFARWVRENSRDLAMGLGPGRHFGEWYGSKVQHGYGYQNGERKFMLFNSARWTDTTIPEPLKEIGVEPSTVLYQGPMDQEEINGQVAALREHGSAHVPGQKAEGVVIFHVAANQTFKVLCENDEIPKGLAE